jgi:hypothetical protein
MLNKEKRFIVRSFLFKDILRMKLFYVHLKQYINEEIQEKYKVDKIILIN